MPVVNFNPELRVCCVCFTCHVSVKKKSAICKCEYILSVPKFEVSVKVMCSSYKVTSVVQREILFVIL